MGDPVVSKSTKPLDNWIRVELKRLYGKAYSKNGVDLNGDGKLQANEKIAAYNSNNIPGYKPNEKNPYRGVVGDWTDWLAFYRANHKLITAKASKNQNSIFHWAAKFKSTNPLHIITLLESPLVSRKKVLSAYRKVWKIVSLARKNRYTSFLGQERAWRKLDGVYKAMRRAGIKFKGQGSKPLTESLDANILDCDTSSFIALAEGHEQNWPVYYVSIPGHAIVRWNNGRRGNDKIRFNKDISFSNPVRDLYYRSKFRVSKESVKNRIYLRELDFQSTNKRELIAAILQNRGDYFKDRKEYGRAVQDYSKSVVLNPIDASAFSSRAHSYSKLGMYRKSLKDWTRAIALDSMNSDYYNNRSGIYLKTRNYRRAAQDLAKALKLNPKQRIKGPLLQWIKLGAKLRTDVQPRFHVVKPNIVDVRTSLAFSVNLFDVGNYSLGSLVELGYGASREYHTIDVTGGLFFLADYSRWSVAAEAAVGYNFHVTGQRENHLTNNGGVFKYGLRWNWKPGQIGLSASIYLQHSMMSPKRFAILPGIGLIWDMIPIFIGHKEERGNPLR